MKKNLTQKKFLIVKCVSIFTLSTILFWGGAFCVYAGIDDNLSGHAWNDHIGWTSINCINTDTCITGVDYGVTIDSMTGNLSGYAWGQNIGWMSFNVSDVAGCPGGTCQPKKTGNSFSGWARLLTFPAVTDDGWMSLNCSNTGVCSTSNYEVSFDDIVGELEGWAWSSSFGWISFNHKNCDDNEDGFSDGLVTGCPVVGVAVSDYAVAYFPSDTVPNAPTITGSTTGSVNTDYEFRFVASNVDLTKAGCLQDDSKGGDAEVLDYARSIHVSGSYAYVTSYIDDGLSIIDISSSTNPIEVGYIQDDNQPDGEAQVLNNANEVYVSGNYAYVTSYIDDGLSIIDISSSTDPIEVGSIQDDNQPDGTAKALNGAFGVHVSGNYAYVTSYVESGFSIIDISSSTDPIEVGSIKNGIDAQVLGFPQGIYVSGNYAYVVSGGSDGLSIIDISSSTDPIEVGSIQDDSQGGDAEVLDNALDVYVSGSYAYVNSANDDGLSIIDISSSTDPIEVGSIQGVAPVPSDNGGIYVSGNYVYITSANRDDGLSIIDISSSTDPIEVGYIQDNNQGGTAEVLDGAFGVYVSGDYAYVAAPSDDGFSIINISFDFLRYGIDWDATDADDSVDEWTPTSTPSAQYVLSGVQASTTHQWSTDGTYIFQVLTEDDGGLYSEWTTHSIEISSNIIPTATIILPNTNEPDPEVILQAGFADDNEDDPMYDECTIIRWYEGDDTCSDSDYLIHEEDPANMTADIHYSVPHTHDFGVYGTYHLYLTIKDSYGGWSDCKYRQVVIKPECSDGEDNDDDRGTSVEEPENWFDNGGGDIDQADPSCFDYASTTPPFDINNPFPHYLPSILYENNNPQCSDGVDNDDDGLIDEEDSGCHTNYIAASSTTYSKFLNQERTCGVDTNGVICDPDETFGGCPIDCSAQFQFIEF